MKTNDHCWALPLAAALLTISGTGITFLLPENTAWYVYVLPISILAVLLAIFDIRCQRKQKQPPEQIKKILLALMNIKDYPLTQNDFNRWAAELIYGKSYVENTKDITDYYSILITNGYIQLTSITVHGTTKGGSPKTDLNIHITEKAKALIKR